MDDLINNIKEKLSTDNLVEMMKDAKVIDNERIKEEDVRRTLEKIDPSSLIDVRELANKLNEITEEAACKDEHSWKMTETSRSSMFTVLNKGNEDEGDQQRLQDLRNVLGKTDPNSLVGVDEMAEAASLKEIRNSTKVMPKKSSGIFGRVLKNSEQDIKDDNDFSVHDNVTGFLD